LIGFEHAAAAGDFPDAAKIIQRILRIINQRALRIAAAARKYA